MVGDGDEVEEQDTEPAAIGPQTGKVVLLGPEGRFGYVSDASGARSYLYVVGLAISNREAAKLRVGTNVQFHAAGSCREPNARLSLAA